MNLKLETENLKPSSTVRISLARLRERAKERPAGYLQEILDQGTIEGDYLRLPRASYETFRAKYGCARHSALRTTRLNSPKSPHSALPRGLGDLVHALAHPLARAIDAVAGTNLQNCPACARRRENLNRIIPFT